MSGWKEAACAACDQGWSSKCFFIRYKRKNNAHYTFLTTALTSRTERVSLNYNARIRLQTQILQNIKVAPKPLDRIFLNFLKKWSLMCKQFWCNKKGSSPATFCVKCSWILEIRCIWGPVRFHDNQNVSESTRVDKLKGYCNIGYQQVVVIFYYKRVSLS